MYGADDLARPIRLFGIVLIILSVLSLGVCAYWLTFRGVLAQVVETGYLPVLMLLGVDVLVFSTGLGVATSKKWGCWRIRSNPGNPCWKRGATFPRERRSGWRATRAGW